MPSKPRAKHLARGSLTPLWFILPAFGMILLFRYYPLFSAFYHSFTRWDIVTADFTGLRNYARLMVDDFFWDSLRNAGVYTLVRVVVILTMCIIGAELVYNLRSTRRSYFWRSVFIIPLVIPISVQILLWGFIFHPVVGMLNELLAVVGLGDLSRAWLGDHNTALFAVAAVGFPFLGTIQFLIILSGLQSIEPTLLEAARTDGTNIIQRIFLMDLPIIMDKIILAITLTVLWDFQNVQYFLVLTGGGPGTSTLVPGLYVYQAAFDYNQLGYSAAIGMAMTVVVLLLVLALNVASRKLVVVE